METNIFSQEEKPQAPPTEVLMPNNVEWTEELLDDTFYEWYKKHSDAKSDFNDFCLFLKGEIDRFDFEFEDNISDADLIRIGFYLGFSYKKQNIAFGKYRRYLKRNDRLDSNRCPKGWQRFNNSTQKVVNEIKHLLIRHGQAFIPSSISKIEQESYKSRIRFDMERDIEKREKELLFRKSALLRFNGR
mgnify:CR=1 FL=1